jgi:hypothetical protein
MEHNLTFGRILGLVGSTENCQTYWAIFVWFYGQNFFKNFDSFSKYIVASALKNCIK